MSARDRRATRLLDPRWHWIQQAAARLYAELEDRDQVATLSVTVATPAGELIVYSANWDEKDITRVLIPDIAQAIRVYDSDEAKAAFVDATPPADGRAEA